MPIEHGSQSGAKKQRPLNRLDQVVDRVGRIWFGKQFRCLDHVVLEIKIHGEAGDFSWVDDLRDGFIPPLVPSPFFE